MAPNSQPAGGGNPVRFTVDNFSIDSPVLWFYSWCVIVCFHCSAASGRFFPSRAPLLRTLAQIRKRAVAAYTQADLYRFNHHDYSEADTDVVHGTVCVFLI